jgi:streptogramin lyase
MRKILIPLLLFVAVALPASGQAGVFIFTNDADWDQGVYASTNSGPPGADHQIQLNPNIVTQFNNIWVALSGRDSVVRIDTDVNPALIGNGDTTLTAGEAGGTAVKGEYLTRPNGRSGNPSRTTVDLNGDVWVGNRNEGAGGLGSATKISASPTGTTSSGAWNGSTFNRLDWTNTGGADNNGGVSTAQDTAITQYVRTTGANVRHVSVDKDNNVWIGGGPLDAGDQVFQLYSPAGVAVPDPDGAGPKVTFFGDNNTGGYGGLVDGNGVVWSAGLNGNTLTRMDPATGARMTVAQGGRQSYGLGIDYNGVIWNATWTNNTVDKIDPNTGIVTASYNLSSFGNSLRGVAATPDNDIWVAASGSSRVIRVNNDGSVQGSIVVGNTPTGVAVDSNGKVWVTNYGSNSVMRIDPTLGPAGAVDLTIDLGVNASPYNYSDMTGTVVRGQTYPSGIWRVVEDSGVLGQAWDKIFWNTEAQGSIPAGTSITISARAADSLGALGSAAWFDFGSGDSLGLIGQFIEVKALLERSSNAPGAPSPILSDLRFTTQSNSVPEPYTMFLLGIGLAALGIGRRYRK